MEAATRIAELREQITRYDYFYYVRDNPLISDPDYDALYSELAALEAKFPVLDSENSPTKRIGMAGPSKFEKSKHDRRMLSLDKVKTVDDLWAFFGGKPVDLMLEPKVDGLSLKLTYKGGKLVKAVTRGDGSYGDDVTMNARTIRTLPLMLTDNLNIEVVGEVYMTYSVFNALNNELESEGLDALANVRNAAAGSLKLKTPRDVAARKLSFVAYGISTPPKRVTTQDGILELLDELGFRSTVCLPVTESCQTVAECLQIKTKEELAAAIEEADKNRRFLNCLTDGLVFKHNQLAVQRELGEGNKYPNWAVAFKFPPERKTTTLLAVTLQVGKTGKITPVAELKPVALAGTIVRRASLCNQDEIRRLGVNIEDTVTVEKANEIIPKVVGVAEKVSDGCFEIPTECPCCGTALITDRQVDWFCPNRDCDEQVFNRLRHATSKKALDMDGCGEVMVRELMKNGVRKLSDIFALKESQLGFIKPAARRRLIESRDKAKKQPFWRQLLALGIDGLGETLCQDVATRWNSLSSVFDELDLTSDRDALCELVGPVVRSNMVEFFSEDANAEELNRLQEYGLEFASQRIVGALTGKVFVITGDLMSGARPAVCKRIEAAGGSVKNNVSRKVHYLVMGDNAGQTKSQAAAKNKVPVITEEQLYKMMGMEIPLDSGDDADPDRDL